MQEMAFGVSVGSRIGMVEEGGSQVRKEKGRVKTKGTTGSGTCGLHNLLPT